MGWQLELGRDSTYRYRSYSCVRHDSSIGNWTISGDTVRLTSNIVPRIISKEESTDTSSHYFKIMVVDSNHTSLSIYKLSYDSSGIARILTSTMDTEFVFAAHAMDWRSAFQLNRTSYVASAGHFKLLVGDFVLPFDIHEMTNNSVLVNMNVSHTPNSFSEYLYFKQKPFVVKGDSVFESQADGHFVYWAFPAIKQSTK